MYYTKVRKHALKETEEVVVNEVKNALKNLKLEDVFPEGLRYLRQDIATEIDNFYVFYFEDELTGKLLPAFVSADEVAIYVSDGLHRVNLEELLSQLTGKDILEDAFKSYVQSHFLMSPELDTKIQYYFEQANYAIPVTSELINSIVYDLFHLKKRELAEEVANAFIEAIAEIPNFSFDGILVNVK